MIIPTKCYLVYLVESQKIVDISNFTDTKRLVCDQCKDIPEHRVPVQGSESELFLLIQSQHHHPRLQEAEELSNVTQVTCEKIHLSFS